MSSSSLFDHNDLMDFVVKQGNGVKGLSEMDLKTVPRQYIQHPEERLDKNQVAHDESIPVIDVSNWDDPDVAASICEAASKWGFFQIVNHGIPLEVLDNVKEAAHKFFELPTEDRRKYLKENSPTPTVQLSTSHSPSVEKVLEWKDVLMHFYVPGDESTNLWPPVSKDQVLEHIKWAKPVIRKLMEVLLKGLNVKEFDEEKESLLTGACTLSLNHYSICPNPELSYGVGPHSDISSITILLQDDVGGLYVRATRAGQWIHVTPIQGALVVNIGDTLQIASNDRYKSIEHCVIPNAAENRVSVPIFASPKVGGVVGPLPEVLKNGEKPIYKDVPWSAYMKHFYSKGHDGKKTIEFAKI
ncbi:bi-functional coumaroyl CoA and feruloyl CoA ortho-hydroxylase F6H2-1-1-like [Coffea arabica]|uniref:feruloyl-CoA 6-hydroxylase n=1 Tax=Coffea arabica TaxID=13443 RepID=A0A6P6VCL1_COFAR|nr:feruloyl CoA ortho-hydroxylase 1-like [Coffea arabica]